MILPLNWKAVFVSLRNLTLRSRVLFNNPTAQILSYLRSMSQQCPQSFPSWPANTARPTHRKGWTEEMGAKDLKMSVLFSVHILCWFQIKTSVQRWDLTLHLNKMSSSQRNVQGFQFCCCMVWSQWLLCKHTNTRFFFSGFVAQGFIQMYSQIHLNNGLLPSWVNTHVWPHISPNIGVLDSCKRPLLWVQRDGYSSLNSNNKKWTLQLTSQEFLSTGRF